MNPSPQELRRLAEEEARATAKEVARAVLSRCRYGDPAKLVLDGYLEFGRKVLDAASQELKAGDWYHRHQYGGQTESSYRECAYRVCPKEVIDTLKSQLTTSEGTEKK